MSEHDIVILKGVSVGEDPMVAGFLVHAVIKESVRLVSRLVGGVCSVTVAARTLTIKYHIRDSVPMEQRTIDLENIKALFSEVARVAYKKSGG
jgi:hypothetical protein